MARLVKFKSAVTLFILFVASAVYAAAISEIVHATTDLTLPLIFNGVAPSAVLLVIGKRYLDHLKEVHKELIDAKNDHSIRIKGVETHIEDCPHCPGGGK